MTLFNDNFNRANNAVVGNGWVETDAATSSIGGELLVMQSTGASYRDTVCYAPAGSDFENGSVEVDFYFDNVNSLPELWVRGSIGGSGADGYVAYLFSNTLFIAYNLGASIVNIASVPFSFSLLTWYTFRFIINGNDKYASVSLRGADEPIVEVSENVDSTITGSGFNGVGVGSSGFVWYDNYISRAETQLVLQITDPLSDGTNTLANETGIDAFVKFYRNNTTPFKDFSGLTTDGSGILSNVSDNALRIDKDYTVFLRLSDNTKRALIRRVRALWQ